MHRQVRRGEDPEKDSTVNILMSGNEEKKNCRVTHGLQIEAIIGDDEVGKVDETTPSQSFKPRILRF